MAKDSLNFDWDQMNQWVLYMIAGILLGARIGYVLIYDFAHYMQAPAQIFAVWKGGLSYHGAAIGAVLSNYIFAKRYTLSLLRLLDLLGMAASVGVIFGRIGNFINAELLGRVTEFPISVVFPHISPDPRHPSQLYEAGTEGLLLAIILWGIYKYYRPKPGVIFSVYLVGYGLFRGGIEFLRTPDAQLGFVFGPFSMGQLLCGIMIVLGTALAYYLERRPS